MSSPYLHVLKPCGADALRLYCFPHAGRGASLYRPWVDSLAPRVEISAIQPPGRESRLQEEPFDRMDALLAEVTRAIADDIARAPEAKYALFGSSMGGVVAFEVARAIARAGLPDPKALFIAGTAAPSTDCNSAIARRADGVTDDELVNGILALGGTPRAVFATPQLRAIVLKILRADLAALGSYVYAPDTPLACPIHVLCGKEDTEIVASGPSLWSRETRGAFSLDMLEGGHLFISRLIGHVGDTVVSRLAAHLPAAA